MFAAGLALYLLSLVAANSFGFDAKERWRWRDAFSVVPGLAGILLMIASVLVVLWKGMP